MKFLMGLNLKTILFLLLAVFIILGIIKKLFKLVIFVAVIGALYFLYTLLM